LNVEYLEISPRTHRGIPRLNRNPITQDMKSRSAVLGSLIESHWNYVKIKHENGFKFRHSFKRKT